MTVADDKRRARLAASLAARRRRNLVLKGMAAVAAAVGTGFLIVLIGVLLQAGSSAFFKAELFLSVPGDRLATPAANALQDQPDYDALVQAALAELVPAAVTPPERRELARLVSIGAALELKDFAAANAVRDGEQYRVAVTASSLADRVLKGRIDTSLPASRRPVSDRQVAWIEELEQRGLLRLGFNENLFLSGDSREPELAGIRAALTGSLLMLVITLLLALPLGVAAAIYLEEFAPAGRLTDLIEVNINNLAAVPSIIFGLLGLAILIDGFGLPRSAPLVGGIVLALLTLPIVIIAARAAIAQVPDSIRAAALALGASRMQVVFDHVLPLALPGIVTGAMIALGRALGETAPLLMIGMVAFIVDVPERFSDPSTAMPVQIYLWADNPEPAFSELTAAATLVLLAVLLLINVAAVIMRQRLRRGRRS